MGKKRIVILAGDRDTTPVVYHALAREYEVVRVVIEDGVGVHKLLKWRLKRSGFWSVFGQGLFIVFVMPFLRREAKSRIQEIMSEYGFSAEPIPHEKVAPVSSVNTDEARHIIMAANPDVVVVHGTRIIGKKTLQEVGVPFINIHAGITPRYRGGHGGYWALVESDPARCGVTVHMIDEGIDTGRILAQAPIMPGPDDNFCTYPWLQLGAGLQLLMHSLEEQPATMIPHKGDESLTWEHPTIWGYMRARYKYGVK